MVGARQEVRTWGTKSASNNNRNKQTGPRVSFKSSYLNIDIDEEQQIRFLGDIMVENTLKDTDDNYYIKSEGDTRNDTGRANSHDNLGTVV